MSKKDSAEELEMFATMAGKQVHKQHSKKPFKSGFKINTVTGLFGTHPVTGRMCFTFAEDESYVECFRCGGIK